MIWVDRTRGSGWRRLRAAGGLALAAAAGAALGVSLARGSEAAQVETTSERTPEKTFETPAGLVLNYVRADQADAFESLVRRLVGAMAAGEDAALREQAAGWKMYRAREPGPNENVLYVWLLDPAVPDADYAAAHLLNEAFPTEVQSLYEDFNGAFGIGQALLNLEPVTLVEGDEPF